MDEEWPTTYQQIKRKHNEAYKTIEMAIKKEEDEEPYLAILNYKLGVTIIDEILQIPVGLPDDPSKFDDTLKETCIIIQKIKRTRAELIQRIRTLTAKYPEPNPITTPCNNNSTITTPIEMNCRPRTYAELAQALNDMKSIELTDNNDFKRNSLELLFTCDNVKLYNIDPSGTVTTASEHSLLRIVSLAPDDVNHLEQTIFLQIIKNSDALKIHHEENDTEKTNNVKNISSSLSLESTATLHKIDNSWIYPLVPGASPCFRTDYGAFIFPDLQSDIIGSAVGIIVPSDSDTILLEIFDALLHGVVLQSADKDSTIRAKRALSDTVSENIIRGAKAVSYGMVKGSEKVGEFVSYSTPYIISKLRPAPSDQPPVSSGVRNTVEIAKSATCVAANVTGYVAGKVGEATMALGRFLAPHIQKQGSRLLTSTLGYSTEEATEKMSGALTIAAGAVEGFGTVYMGLEESAAILGHNLSNNSVKIIEHKYGLSAGSVAATTFDTVGNVINVRRNFGYITPKGMVKRTAKNTGLAIVEDFRPNTVSGISYVPAGALYPNLSNFDAKVVDKRN